MLDPYHHLAGVYDEFVVDPCHALWADSIERWWASDDVTIVLDVCCGSGLMTAELIQRGYHVTGVDASTAMLARARHLLGPDIPLILAVLPDLPTTGPFDAAVSTLDGLNYLTLEQFRRTLEALAGVLRPGGWLVFDVHAEPTLAFLRDHPHITGEQDGARWALTTTIDDEARACTSTLEFTASDPSQSFTETHTQYVHSRERIADALADAGFEIVSVTDEYSDVPVGDTTLRAGWIARATR